MHPVKAVEKNIEKGLIRMKAFSVLILTLYTVRAANIVEVLQKHGATKLVDLAVKAGLAETLTGKIKHFSFKIFHLRKIHIQKLCDSQKVVMLFKFYYVSIVSNQSLKAGI